MPENTKLLQTRVSSRVDREVKRVAKKSGASVATWLRQLVIRELQTIELQMIAEESE